MKQKSTESVPEAIPVSVTVNPAPPATASPAPARIIATSGPHSAQHPGVVEDEHVGVCRRCRRVFERPSGVNDGQAQYFRCAECLKSNWADIIEGSCSLC
ncbi:hypothetical protein EON64_18150 [archaeon]|nr:MAG: hypothetical protein EON64_18150 [archaeon]